MITFLWPWMLLMLPLPWLVRRFAPPRTVERPALRAPFFRHWQSLADRDQQSIVSTARRVPAVALWVIWLSLLLAAARPLWVGDAIELPNSGRDLMLAVDISGSMRVEDMQVGNRMARRIDAVKQLGSDFMSRRSGDRLGLILFGSRAYLQSPLSFDIQTVQRFLLEAQIGFAGQETAIGDAIGLAVKRLQERPASSRVLVLLTDGQDTASTVDPLEAANLAADLGVRIYTIGIGADSLTLPGLLGSPLGARTVNPSADLDESTLIEIARSTGGQYFRARDPEELATVYRLLDQLEPLEVEKALYRPQQSLSALPLLIAIVLSFALVIRYLWQHRAARSAAATAGTAARAVHD
ncbi:vWA domain-containing protein [Congregibacter litoralis]|uniref:Mg-chelatase subunit ChlD n=1 Tax=Congregibacter litoralis KT71 TaxID=314285 RepID=A4A7X1_9GAMM|nr:VWA domain-containing protein [Congregibacter litoralis]EAQ97766.2 Mg-chelatase subunit ChlD [Congregibacter litoralis KT71]